MATALTSKQTARLAQLLKRGVGYRTALALADVVVEGDLASIIGAGGLAGPTGSPAVDTETVNTAKAAGLRLPGGTYVVNTIEMRTGDALLLSADTVLQLAAGTNANLIETEDWATQVGSDGTVSPHNFVIDGGGTGVLDGNRANNTAGHGVALYGYGYQLANVIIRNCKGRGWDTEWSSFSPFIGPDAMESYVFNLRVHDCDGGAFEHRGPHDTHVYSCIFIKNSGLNSAPAGRFPIDGRSNGTTMSLCHIWGGSYDYGLEISSAGINVMDSQIEGATIAEVRCLADELRFDGVKLFTGGVAVTTAKGLLLGTSGRTVSNIWFRGWMYDCGGGAVDFINANSHINIDAHLWWNAQANITAEYVGNVPAYSDVRFYSAIPSGPLATSTVKHWAGATILEPIRPTQVALLLQPSFEGQTADLFRAGSFKLGSGGNVGMGGAAPNTGIPVVLGTNGSDANRAVVMLPNSLTQSANLLEIQRPDTFAITFAIDKRGRVVAGTGHGPASIVAGAAASAASANAGDGGAGDQAGAVTCTAAATPPAAPGVLATITFSVTYGFVPKHIDVQPRTQAAAQAGLYVSSKTATAFVISYANAPAASASLNFTYQIMG